MAQLEVTRLFRAAKSNPDLRTSLNQAPDLETFIKMARKEGYYFTIEEWQKTTSYVVEELQGNLSEIPGL
ncbi:MAG: Nif11-like leader peptide family natural product precursor [Cyanobacteria bacterium J06633_8]